MFLVLFSKHHFQSTVFKVPFSKYRFQSTIFKLLFKVPLSKVPIFKVLMLNVPMFKVLLFKLPMVKVTLFKVPLFKVPLVKILLFKIRTRVSVKLKLHQKCELTKYVKLDQCRACSSSTRGHFTRVRCVSSIDCSRQSKRSGLSAGAVRSLYYSITRVSSTKSGSSRVLPYSVNSRCDVGHHAGYCDCCTSLYLFCLRRNS